MKYLAVCLILIVFLSSCKKDKENVTLKPGQFSFSRLENYDVNLKSATTNQQILAKAISPSPYLFDLGEIKASKYFYFLLLNIGDKPIYDVTLSSDNPNFIISPSKISYLGSTRIYSTNNDFVLPIITLGIEHGRNIDGFGYGKLLNMGNNTCNITIKGKTILNKDTTILSVSPSVSVDAKIMDIRFFVDNQEIDLYHPSGSITTPINGIGTLPYYYTDYINKPVKIENTGNTTINLQILGNHSDTIKLEPNQTTDPLIVDGKEIVFTIGNWGSRGLHAVFILNSEGTAVNNNKLRLLDDGNAYFSIFRWDDPTVPH